MTSADWVTALQDWYGAQCDGEWEHAYGISIESLDNPGWRMEIDLTGTALAGRELPRSEVHRADDDWLVQWVETQKFHAACGPSNLSDALEAFARFAGDVRPA